MAVSRYADEYFGIYICTCMGYMRNTREHAYRQCRTYVNSGNLGDSMVLVDLMSTHVNCRGVIPPP